jgi:uncharacterized protein YjbJ (UPF0337 family)
MESNTKDQAEGTLQEMKGKVKEVAGIITGNPKLEADGAVERIAGKVKLKIGKFNQFWGK